MSCPDQTKFRIYHHNQDNLRLIKSGNAKWHCIECDVDVRYCSICGFCKADNFSKQHGDSLCKVPPLRITSRSEIKRKAYYKAKPILDILNTQSSLENFINNISPRISPRILPKIRQPLISSTAEDFSDMFQKYGIISYSTDLTDPVTERHELIEIDNWFKTYSNSRVISFHASGSDSLIAATEYSMLLHRNRKKQMLLHIGFYGALYGELVDYVASWGKHLLKLKKNHNYHLPYVPKVDHYTDQYQKALIYFMNNNSVIPDELLDPLTREEIDSLASLEEYIINNIVTTCVVEPVSHTGECAFSILFIRKLSTLCTNHQVILVADECLTGIRCSETVFLFEWMGYYPDLVVWSKSFNPVAGIVAPIKESWFKVRLPTLLPVTTSFMDRTILYKLQEKLKTYTVEFRRSLAERSILLIKHLNSIRCSKHEKVEGCGFLIYCGMHLQLKENFIIAKYNRLLPLLDFPTELVKYICRRNNIRCMKCS